MWVWPLGGGFPAAAASRLTGGQVPTTEPNTNLIDVIIEDHRAVDGVFAELETGSASAERRSQLAEHAIAELVRHSVAEEQFMYPAIRERLTNGDEIADHEIEEHSQAERVMKDLQGREPTDPKFDQLLRELIKDVRHHVEEEEWDILPRLRAACAADELHDLGDKVLRAKQIAPTRPHPAAPDRLPANLILDPGAGLIDKIRDGLSHRSV
ncbi:MAG: hemerythrin domain-containing protein [Pseudonocardiaceae bacterium]|nr:hemerythrin domain-containing protein [Pseudonocardiaceae bacterium]